MEVGGLLRHPMNATMHIGIDIQIFISHGIEHTERLLGSGGIVEINQRLIVDGA